MGGMVLAAYMIALPPRSRRVGWKGGMRGGARGAQNERRVACLLLPCGARCNKHTTRRRAREVARHVLRERREGNVRWALNWEGGIAGALYASHALDAVPGRTRLEHGGGAAVVSFVVNEIL